MRRCAVGWLALGAFFFHGGFALAQDSIKALEEELNEAKQVHQDTTTQVMANFLSQTDAAMRSPDAALALYQQAGGTMPAPSPVVTEHAEETPSERDARLAKDAARVARLGPLLQLHCGLMHYAGLFVVNPNQNGLQTEWAAWLQSMAPIYAQLRIAPETNPAPATQPEPRKKKRDTKETDTVTPTPAPAPRTPPVGLDDLKTKAMHDSIISKFLGFNSWGDKEQGGWAVKDLPKLYLTNVLTPLRTPPTQATLDAWDAYIAMMNVDTMDNNSWNQLVYPPLQFDRACDDYTIAPDTEKLEGLVNLVKANPTCPAADEWITRLKKMMADYSAHHGGQSAGAQNLAPVSTPPASAGNPSGETAVQQGDMTVITRHNTNSAPANPQP